MSIITSMRRASVGEMAAEIDRRGRAIESLEKRLHNFSELERQLNVAFDALNKISAIELDSVKAESTAAEMKSIAMDALNKTSW